MSENKGIRKSLLTPCRTVGLKRKSSVGSPAFRATDNDKKSPANPSKSCGEGELNIAQTSSANSLTEQETTKKLKFNEEVSEGRIIAVPPEATSSNEVIIPDTQNNQSMTTELTAADLDSQIEEIERSLRSKKDAIETLESDLVNMKQHDLATLNGLIRKWRAACQEALNELFAEYRSQEKLDSMMTLLNTLGISPQLVHYSEAEMDFYD